MFFTVGKSCASLLSRGGGRNFMNDPRIIKTSLQIILIRARGHRFESLDDPCSLRLESHVPLLQVGEVTGIL